MYHCRTSLPGFEAAVDGDGGVKVGDRCLTVYDVVVVDGEEEALVYAFKDDNKVSRHMHKMHSQTRLRKYKPNNAMVLSSGHNNPHPITSNYHAHICPFNSLSSYPLYVGQYYSINHSHIHHHSSHNH